MIFFWSSISILLSRFRETSAMKKNKVFSYIFLFVIFIALVFVSNLAFAKSNRFQLTTSRDCGSYELVYEGISCRNASPSDVPICDDNEDVLTSPRKSKLCCCTRLLELEEGDEDGNGEEEEGVSLGGGSRFNSCKDFNCKPRIGGEGAEGRQTCPEGFIQQDATKDNGMTIQCCCPTNETTYTDLYCRALSCADILPSFASEGPFSLRCADGLTPTIVETTIPPGTTAIMLLSPTNTIGHSCCCPGTPNFAGATCLNILRCDETTGPGECAPGLTLVDPITIHPQGDESSGNAISCCCMGSASSTFPSP